ncbi:MAG: carbamoyltransferase HypF [bacterium]|nr:carbamoyltransferase HypF [bacterium]
MEHSTGTDSSPLARFRFLVNGVVQGVGFRPFVYRIATEEALTGTVQNGPNGVTIEVEGSAHAIARFRHRLQSELPPQSRIDSLESVSVGLTGESHFQIIHSAHDGAAATLIPPDIATCDDCLRELFDRSDRRFAYPFINCTNCGPRYTIVRSIPYDRPYTSMSTFTMCPSCQGEYDDPADRRFHAQPNGCAICGPRVRLCQADGTSVMGEPIPTAVDLLKTGLILAIRGVGGFHLAVDAGNETAVQRLRDRKGRAEKPLAMMAPDITTIENFCILSDHERALLLSPSRPIVLLKSREATGIANAVAPGQQYLGFMLPYTPLHHLLLRGNFTALVMTSGNLAEEPIAIGNQEALDRLKDIADYFLLHDREILQRCDDSIARIQGSQPRLIRRSRGYVPLPVTLAESTIKPILAVGAELKNTIALSRGNQIFLSQHIGDLDNPTALAFFEQSISHFEQIHEIVPEAIAYDLHPEYLSTQWAQKQALPSVSVQHHHAHLAAVLAEHKHVGKAIGIILDGTGYGTDGTIWGGELLFGDASGYVRSAWLAPVPMPGGGLAIKQPWRMALSHLYSSIGENIADLDLPVVAQHRQEIPLLTQMIQKKINSPLTSSCGRLFDAVAALLGYNREIAYEAQAAIGLEMLCDHSAVRASKGYSSALEQIPASGALTTAPLILSIVEDLRRGIARSHIAADFHRSVVEVWVKAAREARTRYNCNTVALSGGVFQNDLLFELMVDRLSAEQFTVLTHLQVPTNDGGIALGQITVANAHFRRERD